MRKTPLVSVVLPTKNCGAHLNDAVCSILAQSLPDTELILVDDGTTDGSIEGLGVEDRRLKIISNNGNGLVDALNCGVSHAQGDFIARMDGDDISHKGRLEAQVELFEKSPELDIVATKISFFPVGAVAKGNALYEKWINSLVTPEQINREIFVESPLPHPSVMFCKDAFAKLGGYRDMGWPEDYDMWLRAFELGLVMGKTDKVFFDWRDGPRRLSKTSCIYSQKSFMKARSHFIARTIVKNKSCVIWGAGRTGGTLGKMLLDEDVDISRYIDISPRKIGGVKSGRPVVSPEEEMASGNELILVAVAARGAVEEIRSFLNTHLRLEGADYFVVTR